jgi:hypothetical protein
VESRQNQTKNKLDAALNKMIVQSIHNDVMEAMAAKGKIVYEVTCNDAKERLNKNWGTQINLVLAMPICSVLLVTKVLLYIAMMKMTSRQINDMDNCPLSIV